MAYFVFRGYDAPDKAETRQHVRPAHREYIQGEHHGVRVVAGGMLVSDDNDRTIGSMLVMDAADRAAVATFVEGDPYSRARLFERIEIERWDWGLGLPLQAMSGDQ
jgi:uncharacterized protein YciI